MLKYESVNRRLGLDGVLPASSARSGGAEIVGKLAAGGVVLVLEAGNQRLVKPWNFKMLQICPTSIFGRCSF